LCSKDKNRTIVRKNIEALNAFFGEYSSLFNWKEPDGSCVGFIRYKGKDGVEAFTKRLVEESGVLFLPASIYRSEPNDVPSECMSVGFGRTHVPEGLEVLDGWIKRNLE
jgi:aspartate/methionine/tyrosine aminotransferase